MKNTVLVNNPYPEFQYPVGMGQYQYRQYRHIGTFFSISIGNQKKANMPILR